VFHLACLYILLVRILLKPSVYLHLHNLIVLSACTKFLDRARSYKGNQGDHPEDERETGVVPMAGKG